MCSVNEEDLDGNVQCMEKKPAVSLIGDMCKKCNENKAKVVLRVKDVYCRDCFLVGTTHKFRAALGKSKIVRPRDHVLIAYSGSQASAALLHLVHSGLNEANHKRLLFSCSVIYIDEGAVLGTSSSERKDLCHAVIQQVKKSAIPVYITSLEKSLDDSQDSCYFTYGNGTKYVNEEYEEKLKKLLDSVRSITSKEDLLQKLRNKLLLKVAKQLKCTKIFTAETTSHLAVKLLSNTSLGRGAQLPLDIGFCDARDPDVMLLRPMRDFMKKEVVFYNTFNEVESLNIPSLGTKADSHSSIQKLTEKFVTDLQEDFPSTVSTVFRTGDKLTMCSTSDENECCALCKGPLDTAYSTSSALEATEFSRMVSALGSSGFDTMTIGNLHNSGSKEEALPPSEINDKNACETSASDTSTCDASKSCHCKKNDSISHSDVESCLCYSCRLITREMVTLEMLPPEILSSIKKRVMFKEMRKEIEDFLL